MEQDSQNTITGEEVMVAVNSFIASLKKTLVRVSEGTVLSWPARIVTADLFIPFRFIFFGFLLSLLSTVLKVLHLTLFLISEFVESLVYFSKPINPLYTFVLSALFILLMYKLFHIPLVPQTFGAFLIRCVQVNLIPATLLDFTLFVTCFILSHYNKNIKSGLIYLGVFHLMRLPVIVGFSIIQDILNFSGFLFQLPMLVFIIIMFLKTVIVILFHLHFELMKGQKSTRSLQAGNTDQIRIFWEYPKLTPFSPHKFETKLFLGPEEVQTIGNDDIFIHTEYNTEERIITVHYRLTTVGQYSLFIFYGKVPLKGKPISIEVQSGDTCAEKSSLIVIRRKSNTTNNHVYEVGRVVHLAIRLRDQFGNVIYPRKCGMNIQQLLIRVNVKVSELHEKIDILQPEGQTFETSTEDVVKSEEILCLIDFPVRDTCVHHVTVTFDGVVLQRGDFDVIVLTKKSSTKIKNNYNMYTKGILQASRDGGKFKKPTKVIIYSTPTQIYIKEYLLGLIPLYRHFVWPLNSSLNVTVRRKEDSMSIVELGNDAELTELAMELEEAVLLYASITLHMQQKYKSSSFEKRKQHAKLALMEKCNSKSITAVIDRNFLVRDGCKLLLKLTNSNEPLQIHFEGEVGLDTGGLCKEFFTELEKELFLESGLFGPLQHIQRKQISSVHSLLTPSDLNARMFPNGTHNKEILKKYSKRVEVSLAKLYQCCGIVCARILVDHLIYEVDHQLPVTLCHSVMKQILGLSVSPSDFQYDDQELFDSRIKYVHENDPSDLGLTFSDTIMDHKSQLYQEVLLVPEGNTKLVNQDNKEHYLKRLAQYRLREMSEEHLQSFIQGFRAIIPDEIVSVFNPFELTVMICCSRDVKIEEMKQYTEVSGFALGAKEVKWFWAAVECLTTFERKKLLQFITGSSSVPPNGFAALKPRLNIMKSSHPKDSLPMSHTCFNRIDLPSYSSFGTLQEKLVIAVNEGYKGFSFH